MAVDLAVDRSSRLPLYVQLAEQLEAAIIDGHLLPGDRIDTEVELSERLGLGRPTVRQAVQELVAKGLLVRRRGVGTQVVSTQVHRPLALTSLMEDLTSAGHQVTTTVLSLTQSPSSDVTASALRIVPGAPVHAIERLRSIGGQPLAVMRNWVPAGRVTLTADELSETGLYALMRRQGVHLQVAQQRIGARAADTAERRLLDLRAGAPVLTMERTAFDDAGVPVEHALHCYRADRYTFDATLVSR